MRIPKPFEWIKIDTVELKTIQELTKNKQLLQLAIVYRTRNNKLKYGFPEGATEFHTVKFSLTHYMIISFKNIEDG